MKYLVYYCPITNEIEIYPRDYVATSYIVLTMAQCGAMILLGEL